jgi:excisionase family DNA binding protein
MTYTVKQICERFGVRPHTVLAWIGAGELAAMNVGRKLAGKKPRWRVTAEALAAFEAARTAAPPAPRATRRRPVSDVIQFYKVG